MFIAAAIGEVETHDHLFGGLAAPAHLQQAVLGHRESDPYRVLRDEQRQGPAVGADQVPST